MAKRMQLKRQAGWRISDLSDNYVICDRRGNWGNPFNWQTVSPSLSDRQKKYAVMRDFENWLEGQPDNIVWPDKRDWILDNLHRLRGKDLFCWCKLCDNHAAGKPFGEDCAACDPCHCDVLGQVANGI